MRIDRCVAFTLTWLALACSGAAAQTGSAKGTAALNTEVNAFWPDNTTGVITPFNARQTLLDIVASYFNNAAGPLPVANGGTGLTSGTSGGVPYFSSTSTIASSSALTANAIVLGGGAGVSPGVSGCTIDANNSIACASSTTQKPAPSITNSTTDNAGAIYQIVKSRAGGSITTGDGLGGLQWTGTGTGAVQLNAATLKAFSTGTISGSSIPAFTELTVSSSAAQLDTTLRFDQNAHLSVTAQPSAITVGTCTGFALATGATDFGGKLTMSAGTTCSFNFGKTYGNAPACVVSPGSAVATHFVTTSTTQLSVTFNVNQTGFSWVCVGN